ncbi:dihydrolipoyl dehydrogenase family protein [Pelistega europaea]|uniref:NAD(P)/FAD-dependent oxidoreductase n=1 Tax=Pelistega europaea TaxID=106147 RepID=A0A7Y4LBE2_9BURK|nr:NAD(P)/FAD-dependent oxidoreductase [Pelistega europaea]NOL49342.1 NAD(P)/FAD-dependent oxidoreductase [Pelistega europaea]
MKHYDLIVLGWGKAGKTLAGKYASKGKKVAIIEKDAKMYGGTCINVGCLPTKSLVHSAGLIHEIGELGVTRDADFNQQGYALAMARKKAVIAKLNQKNFGLLNDNPNVDVYTGEGKFISDKEIQVNDEVLTAEYIVINTGSQSRELPIKGADSSHVMDSQGMLDVEALPRRLLVVGAGFIGLEFASYFANFGSQVDVFQFNDEFLPSEDADVQEEIRKVLEAKGITFHFNTTVQEFIDQGNNVLVKYLSNGTIGERVYDKVLVSAGRVPNTHSLGLENTKIRLGKQGEILVDEYLRTDVPNVFAVGDVKGGAFFTYISLDDSRIVLPQLLEEGGSRTMNNRGLFATTTFIDPPYARVGENEKTAVAKGIGYTVKKGLSAAVPKAHLIAKTEGFTKLLFDENQILIGAQVFNYEAHENINFFTLAIKQKLTLPELRDFIYTHPIYLESMNDFLG